MRILLTVFEAFGGALVNASDAVGQQIAAQNPDTELLLLPVVAGTAEARLAERLSSDSQPGLIVSLGEADDTPVVRLEKVAVNWDDFRIPDNAGNQPRDAAIQENGPAAYFSTVPVGAIARQLGDETPLPVVISLTAGAFVCNHLAYATLHALSGVPNAPAYLFVHVPRWRPDTGDGVLSVQDIAETVQAVLDAAATLLLESHP